MRPSSASLLFDPVPGQQVHASSLLVLGARGYLVAWFAGAHEGAADSRITVARFAADRVRRHVIAPDDDQPHWNPVLWSAPDDRTWLFFKRGRRIDEWTTWVCYSADHGMSWSRPVELVPGDRSGGRGPVRQPPVAVDGLWLAPGSVERWTSPLRWDCFIDISADGGRTWQQVALPLEHTTMTGAGGIQPCLLQLPDATFVVFARSTAGRVLRSATSNVFSWPPLAPTDLPNNNSGIAAGVLPHGRLVIAHNDSSESWGSRSRLVLSTSDDGGLTWAEACVVQDGGASPTGHSAGEGRPAAVAATGVRTSGLGEYSYPSMAVLQGELWLTYTWQRQSIALTSIPLDRLH